MRLIIGCFLLLFAISCAAQQTVLVSKRITKDAFSTSQFVTNTLRKIDESSLLPSFSVDCGHELIWLNFLFVTHPHGWLGILRFDDKSMDVFVEQLSSERNFGLKGRVVNFDSSSYIYKGFMERYNRIKQDLFFYGQGFGKSDKKVSRSRIMQDLYTVRECQQIRQGLVSYGYLKFKDNDEGYPNSNIQALLDFLSVKIQPAYAMEVELSR